MDFSIPTEGPEASSPVLTTKLDCCEGIGCPRVDRSSPLRTVPFLLSFKKLTVNLMAKQGGDISKKVGQVGLVYPLFHLIGCAGKLQTRSVFYLLSTSRV